MSSRKKLIVSLSVVALVVIAAVVAVVGVFAAGNQEIQSQVYITFTAVDIEGTVTVRYNTQTVDATTLSDWEGYAIKNAGTASFLASEAVTTKSLAIGTADAPIHIPGSSYAAVIEYVFTCEDVQYGATVSFAHSLFTAQIYNATASKWENVTGEGYPAFAALGEDKTETVMMRIYPSDFAKNISVADYSDAAIQISWALAS